MARQYCLHHALDSGGPTTPFGACDGWPSFCGRPDSQFRGPVRKHRTNPIENNQLDRLGRFDRRAPLTGKVLPVTEFLSSRGL